MRINIIKQFFLLLFLVFVAACSTKKNTFLSRNSHALSTKYNILYNGGVGFDKGVQTIKSNNDDDFWQLLPPEKMQLKEEILSSSKPSNADFELAETKATKAIQKHSMNIGGRERNSQIDEAYLMLGKARYFDQRFVPALDAFNYILYKYPNSSRIYEAKIWREKTNMRLGNDALVIKNISKLLEDHKVKKQVFADANALLTASFLNIEEKDSAVAKIKLAIEFTKLNQDRARYRFILGQLYQQLGYKDSAIASYQSVIEMKRKAERKFVIQAHAKKAELFDFANGDFVLFEETFDKLVKDRENRPYKDLIFYNYGMYHDKKNNQKQAREFYSASLKANSKDPYLIASNYRNLGNMYFREANYPIAAKYYDSTLVKLNIKSREFLKIQKIRKNLDEVILYEAVAERNDSILTVVALNPSDRISYFENYIDKLKKEDETKRLLEEKNAEKQANIDRNNAASTIDPITNAATNPPQGVAMGPPAIPGTPSIAGNSTFYFYNPTTIAFGKLEFKKIWGNRAAIGNWRMSTTATTNTVNDTLSASNEAIDKIEEKDIVVEKYTTEFYLTQLPVEKVILDSINKERNFANYQLGIIYKEKFKENLLAVAKLEKLLSSNPEEKLVLPAMYNLYKLYQITDVIKATTMKNSIIAQYPDSRYAQILNNANPNADSLIDSPEGTYTKWYRLYEQEQYAVVLAAMDQLILQFSGEEIISKLELLKANAIGKLKGVTAYKDALQDVADNYPNTDEGKNAQLIISDQIPYLEKMEFVDKPSNNWKILYRVGLRDDQATKDLQEKIKSFIDNGDLKNIYFSFDGYTATEQFITIHGINSKLYADDIAFVLADKIKYKITNTPIVVSAENYKVIQIKKNLETYLTIK
ncbi:protein involved in gliding motility SprE [Flavobacterium micromati]|uniref:Protein involved in gliding motility SprE n=1 Tax=Flavobacterium micromati TaxID=229205 RepID=A0A1M5L128_9FLAO|nr:tetratricopeptide repeat protein [Flavobacterium micromati]SHG58812.1 protein involved in gliding motility SprE [Flavobacterium micromati]